MNCILPLLMRLACPVLIGLFCLACTTRQPTLFTIRDADETGLHFANTITESDSLNILRFEYMYNGGGVGVGDFNNDGLPDLFFAGNQVKSKLFLNRSVPGSGELHFEDVTEASGIISPYWNTGVSVVDINQDGLLDIYVCTINPRRGEPGTPNQFFINQGIRKRAGEPGVPAFKDMASELGLADQSYSTQAVFFDYDLDHDLDCYLLTNALESFNRNEIRRPVIDGSGLSTDRLYRNERGTFTNVSRQAGINQEGWGLGVGVADLNQDGYPDVYCANDFQSNDLAWINNHNGSAGTPPRQGTATFTNQIGRMLMHQSHNAMGCDIADINNDGLLDIMTLDMMPYTNRRIKSMFGVPNYDRYELNFQLGYQPQFVRNSLQLNRGSVQPDSLPRFSEIGQLAGVWATDWSWAPLFADFDNDGWRDLFITNGYPRDVTDLDFTAYNAESAMFGDSISRKRGIEQKMNELVGVKGTNFLYRSRGADTSGVPTFEDVTTRWASARVGYSNGAAYADFDHDGDLDLVVNNLNDEVLLYQNNLRGPGANEAIQNHYLRLDPANPTTHDAGFGAKVWVYAAGQRWYAEHTPYRGYKSSVEPVLHFGLGTRSTVDSVVVEWPGGQRTITRNLPADSTYRLATLPKQADRQTPSLAITPLLAESHLLDLVHTENPYTDLNENVLWRQLYSRSGPYMATGDVNGDGRDDMVMGGSAGSTLTICLQTASGMFQKQFLDKYHAQEDCGLALFDADNDRDLDLYVVSGGSEFAPNATALQDRLYLNDGCGRFTKTTLALPDTRASGSCVRACDFDHDGDQDLFVGGRLALGQYPAAPRSYLLRNNSVEYGNSDRPNNLPLFTDVTPSHLRHVGMVTDALWADLDRDSWADLVLVGEFMPVLVCLNAGGQLTGGHEAFPHSAGWWNCVTATDFDRDGDLDLMAGNFGLNTRFQASAQQPVSIYAKDYDNNGRIDPILCYFVQGQEVPAHPRDALALQIPALKKKFTTYAQYGQLTFSDLLSENERAGGFAVRATEMRSVYLENRGQGQFSMKPLPMLAQVSPVNQILTNDLNADGWPDALLVGNQFGADPQVGRQDAGLGLVLAGGSQARFSPLPMAESGLCVPADARSVVALRVGSRLLVVVGCNRGRVFTMVKTDRVKIDVNASP
jgi:hypothetical protein